MHGPSLQGREHISETLERHINALKQIIDSKGHFQEVGPNQHIRLFGMNPFQHGHVLSKRPIKPMVTAGTELLPHAVVSRVSSALAFDEASSSLRTSAMHLLSLRDDHQDCTHIVPILIVYGLFDPQYVWKKSNGSFQTSIVNHHSNQQSRCSLFHPQPPRFRLHRCTSLELQHR